jgi:hypothetical protein
MVYGHDCQPFPVAIASIDLNEDGRRDLAIVDTGCGSQVAIARDDCSYDVAAWETRLPSEPPTPNLEPVRCAAGGEMLALVSTAKLTLLEGNVPVWSQAADFDFSIPLFSQMYVSDIAIAVATAARPGPGLLFQHGADLSTISCQGVLTPGGDLAPAVADYRPLPGALRFAAFDQWTAVQLKGCSEFALAVGRYPPDVSVAPRRLRRMVLEPTGYDTARVSDVDVDAVAVVADDAHDAAIVGMLTSDGGARSFTLARLDCAGFQVTATLPLTRLPLEGRYALRATGTIDAGDVAFWWSDGKEMFSAKVTADGLEIGSGGVI